MRQEVHWSWSDRKNAENLRKHKIPFVFAQRVFDDPLHVSEPDDCAHEERWLTYGRIQDVLIVVVHTEPCPSGTDGHWPGALSVPVKRSHTNEGSSSKRSMASGNRLGVQVSD